jgi:hypothetical protein
MSLIDSHSRRSNFQTGAYLEAPNAPESYRTTLSRRPGSANPTTNVPEILKLLSELVDGKESAVLDIESYVHRSQRERKDEVAMSKTASRIKRPLNAFMLYRKVYQKHVKKHFTINNHRFVSQLCGASWALEPGYIRRKYTEWAMVERDNHAKTWPGYKFSPQRRAVRPSLGGSA